MMKIVEMISDDDYEKWKATWDGKSDLPKSVKKYMQEVLIPRINELERLQVINNENQVVINNDDDLEKWKATWDRKSEPPKSVNKYMRNVVIPRDLAEIREMSRLPGINDENILTIYIDDENS